MGDAGVDNDVEDRRFADDAGRDVDNVWKDGDEEIIVIGLGLAKGIGAEVANVGVEDDERSRGTPHRAQTFAAAGLKPAGAFR